MQLTGHHRACSLIRPRRPGRFKEQASRHVKAITKSALAWSNTGSSPRCSNFDRGFSLFCHWQKTMATAFITTAYSEFRQLKDTIHTFNWLSYSQNDSASQLCYILSLRNSLNSKTAIASSFPRLSAFCRERLSLLLHFNLQQSRLNFKYWRVASHKWKSHFS